VPVERLSCRHHQTRSTIRTVSACALGYAAGAFPSADLAARLAAHDEVRDLRREGTGNPGALNAGQLLGWYWGLGVLVTDMSKGAAAAIAGRWVGGDVGAYAAAASAIAGHVAPPRRGLRGGKGVATSAGTCLAVFPAYFPIDAGVAVLSAARSRDSSSTIRWCCAAWTAAAVLWWQRSWPNAWGPKPSAALPAFAAAGSFIILSRIGWRNR
jgi:glycerol-3-phosphate acyltransferase PlsY